jgi:hypothetical protein
VSALRRYRPLFYNLGDETGIADLTAFWDFDLSAPSLAAMREWLKGRYGDLARLNQEWGAAFSSWEAVAPMMMREAIGRTALGRLQPTGYGANCQTASNRDPRSARKRDPSPALGQACPGSE